MEFIGVKVEFDETYIVGLPYYGFLIEAVKTVASSGWRVTIREGFWVSPKGPKYLYGRKLGFYCRNYNYGLGKYTPCRFLESCWNICRV